MNLIFDTHAHYDDSAFDEDREELLSGLLEKGVGKVVNAAASARSMPRILGLSLKYDFLYAAAGLHPCEVYGCGDNIGQPVMHLRDFDGRAYKDKWPDGEFVPEVLSALDSYDTEERIDRNWTACDREERLIRAMISSDRVVAVGEIGLDYHYDDTRKDIQKDWMARQMAIAAEYGLPVIIHSRDAAADTLDLIRSEKRSEAQGIIHCFSYSKEIAAQYMDMGFMIGIGGVVTYKNSAKIKDIVSYMPMEHMVLETDCPYLAPAPFRGKRNDSSMIKYVVQTVSALKGIPEEEVILITGENAGRLYRIKD